MRFSRQLAVVIAFLILQLLRAFADDVITNVMSPVVSYQYYDALGTDTNSPITSLTISYQFYDSFEHAGTNSMIISPIVSYQYFDSLGAGSVQYINSPSVSYYYQFVTSPDPVVLHGRVTDTSDVPIAGAAVGVMVAISVTEIINTDANGYYQIPPLNGGGGYSLLISANGYQSQLRSLTVSASTAQQDFHLKPMPPPPNLLQEPRSVPVNYTIDDLMGSNLRIFDGTTFVPVTVNNWPSANLKTIVMTHGWVNALPDSSITNTPFDRWPTNMAAKLQGQGVTPATANILAWDWRYAAMAFLDPGKPADRTSEQGVALGEALQHYLGASYAQPLHFLGHSLGTLVNASAINYLHGEKYWTLDYSPTPWKNNLVHVTLFDQAQLAIAGTAQTYQGAMPFDCTWADNYKSIVGLGNFSDAVNVNLQKGILTAVATSLNPLQIADDSHSYPMDWYGTSIILPSDQYNPLGFKRSYEYAPSFFPPSDIETGSTYHQTPSSNDELALELATGVSSLGLLPDTVVQTTVDTVKYTRGVTVQIVDTTQSAASSFFNFVSSVAAQGGQAVVNYYDSAALNLALTITPPLLPLASQAQGKVHPLAGSNDNSSSTPPMAWLPIYFPTNAVAMAFDFMAEGNPADDALVCGVGTNNLFSLAAKYIPTNAFSASRLIAVSQWAGTTNELFFGFLGGTATNATLQIQSIRFYSLQPPQLAITQTGNGVALAWPNTAGGYAVTTTTNLTMQNWQTVSNAPAISGNNYVLTNFWPDQMRFFRLQQQ